VPEKIKDSTDVETTARSQHRFIAGEIEFGVASGSCSSHGECDSEIAERNQVDLCSVRDFTELRVCENAYFDLALIS
jgi:hypothetical protein